MAEKFLMGNEAMAWGAIHSGVGFVSGYPGTPSTEILETVAKNNDGSIHVEWSVNEKSALEAAAGAAYTGMRSLVTMKQVGLNVASDPLMSLAYIGVKGGMVIAVADDPGPISSQTEQDTRMFGSFAKVPVLDPSSPEEAYTMMREAFLLSEKYQTPVILRPTTRVCHGCANVKLTDQPLKIQKDSFVKDDKWVIFPKLALANHQKICQREPEIAAEFSKSDLNATEGQGKKAIATAGISYSYTKEALSILNTETAILKIGTPYPFPADLALSFLKDKKEVLVIEELEPVIERELLMICGQNNLPVKIRGKLTGDCQCAGENTVAAVTKDLATFLDLPLPAVSSYPEPPELPIRPPVLCAGCPHRASFYAVKQSMKGKKAVFSGDIGCYTLGNAAPLNMVDTCLCMGAGITIAQGMHKAEPDTVNFAFVGDSTFFHTGLAGIANAVYNQHDIVVIVLDNSTTAMTGHQPHPGIGKTMMGSAAEKIDIKSVLLALGVKWVAEVNPLDTPKAIETVTQAAAVKGISAVIFRSPCIAVAPGTTPYTVNTEACVGCKKCVKSLGCPALTFADKKAAIDQLTCYGCGLCAKVCPQEAIMINQGGDQE